MHSGCVSMASRLPIRYFNRDNDLPLTVGLMIDTSGSETIYFDTEALAGDVFLRNTLTNRRTVRLCPGLIATWCCCRG